MNDEAARELLSTLVEWLCVPPIEDDPDDVPPAPGEMRETIQRILRGDTIETCCSEGCQGVDRVPDAPGFVLDMASGKRFHVTVRELKS